MARGRISCGDRLLRAYVCLCITLLTTGISLQTGKQRNGQPLPDNTRAGGVVLIVLGSFLAGIPLLIALLWLSGTAVRSRDCCEGILPNFAPAARARAVTMVSRRRVTLPPPTVPVQAATTFRSVDALAAGVAVYNHEAMPVPYLVAPTTTAGGAAGAGAYYSSGAWLDTAGLPHWCRDLMPHNAVAVVSAAVDTARSERELLDVFAVAAMVLRKSETFLPYNARIDFSHRAQQVRAAHEKQWTEDVARQFADVMRAFAARESGAVAAPSAAAYDVRSPMTTQVQYAPIVYPGQPQLVSPYATYPSTAATTAPPRPF